MEKPPQDIDIKIEHLRKNIDALTNAAVIYLNEINRVLKQIEKKSSK